MIKKYRHYILNEAVEIFSREASGFMVSNTFNDSIFETLDRCSSLKFQHDVFNLLYNFSFTGPKDSNIIANENYDEGEQ